MFEIRRGVTRTVILTRRWAIKVPALGGNGRGLLWSLTAGIQANLSERQWSTSDNVVPIVWSLGGVVNVYRRAMAVAYVPSEAYPPLTHANGIPLRVDPKLANVGILDGHLVWVDYDQTKGEGTGCQVCRAELVRVVAEAEATLTANPWLNWDDDDVPDADSGELTPVHARIDETDDDHPDA